jgi:NADH-quinone oxidoreductase subunit M
MLYLYRRVVFGTVTREDVRAMLDLGWREKLVFAPLILLVFWMGIYPSSFLDPMKASVTAVIQRGQLAARSGPHLAQAADLAVQP